MASDIYTTRMFFVSECGLESELHEQSFRISQGCLLSPYLFIILMSVLAEDARDKIRFDYGISSPDNSMNEWLYSGDTLLFGAHGGPM